MSAAAPVPPAGAHARPRVGESARSLVYTVLGEFVHPTGGSAWTETLLRALAALGVEEQATRQALNRVAIKGGLRRERAGRRVRWALTDTGRRDSELGAALLSAFAAVLPNWDGHWVML